MWNPPICHAGCTLSSLPSSQSLEDKLISRLLQAALIRGPKDHINRRISHRGAKAQYEGYTRNHGLEDPMFMGLLGLLDFPLTQRHSLIWRVTCASTCSCTAQHSVIILQGPQSSPTVWSQIPNIAAALSTASYPSNVPQNEIDWYC